MSYSDVVDVLLGQHERMRQLCAAVDQSAGADKKHLFAELDELVNLHELGDRAVVHPATRESTVVGGDAVALACMAEEGNIERAVAELNFLGVEDAAFDGKFATVWRAILEHLAYEEREEFPLLRQYVRAAHLHTMASELNDFQIMGVR
jgi:Hemerythrin HHE cation binding domain